MSTIIASREGMACDSLASGDGMANCSVQKVWRIGDGLVGVVGAYSYAVLFIRHLKAWEETGEWPDEKPNMEGVAALMLSPDGIYRFDQTACPWRIEDKAYALGSGGQSALGAFHAGASLRDSVKIAAKLDSSTGGRIKVYKLEG